MLPFSEDFLRCYNLEVNKLLRFMLPLSIKSFSSHPSSRRSAYSGSS